MENSQTLKAEKDIIIDELARNSLKELYYRHYNDLYYYGLKLSGSKELTRDCIQDLFLQFWSNCDQLSEVRSIKAYLLKCLRRKIFFSIGKERRNSNLNMLIKPNEASMSSVEDTIISSESEYILEQKINKARQELTTRQQEVLYLKYHLGYTYSMICEIMDIKYQSVRNLLSESIKLMRLKMDTEFS